ncbi:FtsB family cell division protein [Anaerosalibacter sp. Marseille-P3206]|uniref:FtsB family cell division protein n=1 Tax=Anaerosalibacter sp. Marseille-P3206 TaxID=1871005 RepID=UPI001F3466A7|nr:septum formation initiator family protein [Anaerosalibacter sp. Marseille-P3206]
MAKGKVKNKGRIRFRHVLIFMFAIYIVSTLISQRSMMKELEAEKAKNEEEIEVLQMEIKELDSKIKSSDSLEFIEKVAREELKMVKPREIIYVDKNKNKDPFLMKNSN